MSKEEQIKIPLSKTKITLCFLASLIFIGLGVWFLVSPVQINIPVLGSIRIIYIIIGIASILFFGTAAIILLRKILDKKAGLIINREGIINNSSGVATGLIHWTDIQEIKISQFMKQEFLMLIVKNPQDYLNRETNALKRKMMELNYKSYGSPICVSASSLQINFDDLNRLLNEKLNEY